jgi:predicted bacteriocin transport accessory protein
MKKIIGLLVVMMIVLSGCSSDKGLEKVEAKSVIERLDNDESLVVVIGQSTCSACLQYIPVLEEVIKNYTVNLAYVEIDKDNKDDVSQLVEDYLIEANATPTTYFFEKGELVGRMVGYFDYRETKKMLESNGFLEEE